MSDDLAEKIIRRASQLKSMRANWDNHFNEVADYYLPSHAVFTSEQVKGVKKTQNLYDSTALVAVDRFGSYMDSMLTPRSQRWHGLIAGDEELDNNENVSRYFDQVARILFRARYNAKANFSAQMRACYTSIGVFGSSVLFISEALGGGHLQYRSMHLSDCYFSANNSGVIDTVFIKFKRTVRQAVLEYGEDRLPEELTKLQTKSPEQEFEFWQAIYPSTDTSIKTLDSKSFPFASVVVCCAGKTVVSQSGFRTFPLAVGRLETAPEEIYARSPAMLVLPEVKTLNQIRKSNLRGMHRRSEPPVLAFSDGIATRFSLRPNHINYGALDNQGRELMKPFATGDRPNDTLQEINDIREIINDAFMINLFQILSDNGQQTATEVLQREQEKVELMSSKLDKIQNEKFGSMIEREIDLLNSMGMLPEMPPELKEADGQYDIQYENPFAKLQKRQDIESFRRAFGLALEMGQVDPNVMQLWNYEEVIRDVVKIEGLNSDYLMTREEWAESQQQLQAQQQLAGLAQAAPGAAQAVKSLAEAEAIRQ